MNNIINIYICRTLSESLLLNEENNDVNKNRVNKILD